jgi:uncharacterized protein
MQMLTFISIALTVYGAMHFYALHKIWLAFTHSAGLAAVLFLLGIVMTLSPLILWQLTRHNLHGAIALTSWIIYLWLGFIFLFCSTALLFDLGQLVFPLLGFKWPLNNTLVLFYSSLITLAFFSYGFFEASAIQIEKITISTPKLSSGHVTIAQISDLHLGAMLGDKFLQCVISKLQELKPDIIVATGDIVDGQGDDFNALAMSFHTLQPPHGLYAITGNHEYFAGLDNSLHFLRNAGFTVLRGDAAATGGIVLVGVDDPSARMLEQDVKLDTRQALLPFSKTNFVVLLKHQPVVDQTTAFDLQLSGHVHGGQIFPFGLLTRLSYGVHTGLTHLADGRLLYVSRGTGTWGPPLRLFAPPEITLITIESTNP